MTVSHDPGADSDDSFWRRPLTPAPEPGRPAPAASPDPAPADYPGPPTGTPPPPGWRPPVHVQPPPPRRLPEQDLARLDTAEENSRTVTYGVGLVAGAVMVVLTCLLCTRLLF